jgi:hypothetical protein
VTDLRWDSGSLVGIHQYGPLDIGYLSWPLTRCSPPQETLTESEGRRRWQVLWARNYFCNQPKRSVFDGSARDPRPSTYFARDSIVWTRSMGYLFSSVDPVLYCDTNGPTHAPTVFTCSIDWFGVCFFTWLIADCALPCLASLSVAAAYSSCVVRFINYACGHDLLPLYFDLLNSGVQFH